MTVPGTMAGRSREIQTGPSGKLEQILTRMAGRPIEVFGSGRTDRGVHAEGQTANFHLKQTEEYEDKSLQILEYINTYLPEDIAVLSCEAVPERFHSRLSAARKTYRYQIEMSLKRTYFKEIIIMVLVAGWIRKKWKKRQRFLSEPMILRVFAATAG